MSRLQPIGILGGMGPEATVLLQQRLIATVTATDDSDHIPLIVDMNSQVPSRIAHLIDEGGEDPGPVLARMAKRLQTAGAKALAMPCNTAHFYSRYISDQVDLPLLHMIDLSIIAALKQLKDGDLVGMLASPAVETTGLFDKAFARHGFETLWPQDPQKILAAIRLIKSRGPCDESKDILRQASEELYSQKAGLQLIACSEFSMITHCVHPNVTVIDTLDVLVSAIRDFSFNLSAGEVPQ